MKIDGDLPTLFCENLPHIDWQKIESAMTGQGIPDLNGCLQKEFWIECKLARGRKVLFEPFQIAWHERRVRAGGSTFIAVRYRTKRLDDLLLFDGQYARRVEAHGIDASPILAAARSGPSRWNWGTVSKCLIS